jgi:hypothetical protein
VLIVMGHATGVGQAAGAAYAVGLGLSAYPVWFFSRPSGDCPLAGSGGDDARAPRFRPTWACAVVVVSYWTMGLVVLAALGSGPAHERAPRAACC